VLFCLFAGKLKIEILKLTIYGGNVRIITDYELKNKYISVEAGVRKDLIGKFGAMPTRSRHCIRERIQIYVTGANALGRLE